MYAIITSGGKQHRVEEGDEILVDLLENVKEGDSVEFSEVLLVSDGKTVQVGNPIVSGYAVKGTCLDMAKGPKIRSVRRFVQRQNHRFTRFGHRQKYNRIRIEKINKKGASKAKAKEEAAEA